MKGNQRLPKHILTTAIYDLIESVQETFVSLMLEESDHVHNAVNNLLEIWLLFTRRVVSDPDKLSELQTNFWHEYLLLCQDLNTNLIQNPAVLRNALLMSFIEKFYFLISYQVRIVIKSIFAGDESEERLISFYNRQFIEAFSVNNFINTNLDVLYSAMAVS